MRVVIRQISTAVAVLTAALLALPQPAPAQSLGEAAERAKKERKGGKTKVITETDLRQAGGSRVSEPPVSASEAAPEAAAAPAQAEGQAEVQAEGPGSTESSPPSGAKTEDELRAEAQAAWRDRMQKAQADVTRLTTEANQLQLSLNDLSQNVYGTRRTAAMNRLDEVKKQLATAQQSVVDLEEEGRRSRFRQ
jgi:hypothetical protein